MLCFDTVQCTPEAVPNASHACTHIGLGLVNIAVTGIAGSEVRIMFDIMDQCVETVRVFG